jgi:hypothetical protein
MHISHVVYFLPLHNNYDMYFRISEEEVHRKYRVRRSIGDCFLRACCHHNLGAVRGKISKIPWAAIQVMA